MSILGKFFIQNMKKNNAKILNVSLLMTLVICLLSCKNQPKKVAQKNHPNLIVIMTDDLGYVDVGFNGSVDIPTPNIATATTSTAQTRRVRRLFTLAPRKCAASTTRQDPGARSQPG